MKLHEVEPFHAEAAQRAVDGSLDIRTREIRQKIEVGHALGVHADRRRAHTVSRTPFYKKAANQRLHSRIDVRAVEGRNASLGVCEHISNGRGFVHRTVSAGKLPAALDKL
jgi:hypothetical protein